MEIIIIITPCWNEHAVKYTAFSRGFNEIGPDFTSFTKKSSAPPNWSGFFALFERKSHVGEVRLECFIQ